MPDAHDLGDDLLIYMEEEFSCQLEDGSPADIGMFGGQGSLALEFYDQDHDGYVLQDDCDDLLDTVHPDQDEYCDELNIDDNCNGLIDNADTAWQNASQLYPDTDGDGAGDYYASPIEGCPTVALVANADDGYGDASASLSTCVQPLGFVLNPDDCDDSTNLIGLPTLWYADFDGDGHGTPMNVLQACEAPLDYVASLDDCDDNDGAIFPGAVEVPANGVDNDCDGLEDCYVDFDQDGYGNDSGNLTTSSVLTCLDAGVSASMDDCSDGIPAYHPDAIDGMANGFDENCDGVEDCWEDLDLDLYGSDVVIEGSIGCNAAGEADIDGDCDDSTAATYPGGPDPVGDGIDGDCDGTEYCFNDFDGDTHGSALPIQSVGNTDCLDPGESSVSDDCNDADATIYPGAPEVQGDGIDQSCDDIEDCYPDTDGDGYGVVGAPIASALGDLTCTGAGVSLTTDDCSSNNPNIYPGATEIAANGVDEDCDTVDHCFTDGDGDTYGSVVASAGTNLLCNTSGESATNDDCDDGVATINPGAPELPVNGVDENCDGLEDCYVDGDGDTWGSLIIEANADLLCQAAGLSAFNSDCDDADASLNVDDADGDGYSTCTLDCDDGDATLTPYDGDGDSYSTCTLDCDDGDATRSPVDGDLDGVSGCDGDCDDTDASLNVDDVDGDGFSTCTLDCDDSVSTVYPGATEILDNMIDEDCDGVDQVSGTTGTGTTGTGTTGTGTTGTGTGTTDTLTTNTLTTGDAKTKASGCDSTGGAPLAWTFLIPLLGLRRRR